MQAAPKQVNKLWKKVIPEEGDSNPIAAAAARVAAAMAARRAESEVKPVTIMKPSEQVNAVEAPKLSMPPKVKESRDPVEMPKPVEVPKSVEVVKPTVTAPPIPPAVNPLPISNAPEEDSQSDDHLLIEVVGVIHPAHRLNRRVHIWNYSSGFSFDSVEDLHQFIYDIRDSGDAPLANLSFCPQDTFLDWSDTMNALRNEEAKVMAEMFDDKVQLIINVKFMVGTEAVTTQNYKISFSDGPTQIAAKVNSATLNSQYYKGLIL